MSCPLRHVIKDSEQLRERGGRKVYEDVFWTSFFDFNFTIGNFMFVNMICIFLWPPLLVRINYSIGLVPS